MTWAVGDQQRRRAAQAPGLVQQRPLVVLDAQARYQNRGRLRKIVAPAAKGEETLIERADVDLGGSSFEAAQSVDKLKHCQIRIGLTLG